MKIRKLFLYGAMLILPVAILLLAFVFPFFLYDEFPGITYKGDKTIPVEEIIIKVSTLVFFFGVAFLIPQDVFDKKERDELGDFSFQSIVPSAKLCAALLLALHMVVITWIHYWKS